MRYNSIAPVRLSASILVLLGMVAPILILCSCRAGPSSLDSITVAVPPLEQNALLYVAEDQGLFQDHGLEVIITNYDTGVDTVNALLAGQADVAELAEFPFIKPVLENQSLRILAVNDRFENDYLVVRKDRGIDQAADLAGKKIGLIRGTILEFYLGRFLELNGLGLDDVTLVDTASTSLTAAAMTSGELDAIVAFQPHVSAIQAWLGDGAMIWPVQSGQLVYGILVSNAGWLGQNGDIAQRFLEALSEAETYVAAHPDRARDIVQDRLNLDGDYIASVWPLHQFTLSLDFSLIVALNDEMRWMMDHGLVSKQPMPNFQDYIYIDGLQEIKPEAVHIFR